MKTLIFDTETSHAIAAVFSPYPDYISHENFLEDWHMFCAGWKWLGEPGVYTVSVLDDPKRFKKNHRDDYHVVKTLAEVIEQADVVVAHNGKKFDIRKLKARMFLHKMRALAPVKMVDTLQILRSEFALTSNRLDAVCKQLGYEGKKKTSPGLWLRALKGDREAIVEMVSYMGQDVTELEALYLELQPWIKNHPNRHIIDGTPSCNCVSCNSAKIKKRGFSFTNTRKYQRRQCCDCGKWQPPGETVPTKETN